MGHFNDDSDIYAEINMKEHKPGWQISKPVERVHIKYNPKENLPTHKAILPNHIEKEVKTLNSDVWVINEANHNINYSQK